MFPARFMNVKCVLMSDAAEERHIARSETSSSSLMSQPRQHGENLGETLAKRAQWAASVTAYHGQTSEPA